MTWQKALTDERDKARKRSIMRKSLKGALLSGLVFPGYGQFVMKHYIRGVLLMLMGLACLVVIGEKVR